MATIVLIIHLVIAAFLIGLVLLQRSDGGALGIGGGGAGGGLVSGRGAANFLTRTTAVLAAAFFGTSLILTLLARNQTDQSLDFTGATDPSAVPAIEIPEVPVDGDGSSADDEVTIPVPD